MVKPGDVIENPVTGERIRFIRTSSASGGSSAQFDLEMPSGSEMIGEHIHLVQEERFEVLEGTLRMRLNGEETLHGPGETVVVPAAAPHSLGPDGDNSMRVRVTFTPGGNIEEFFDEFFRLAREGRTNAKGMPSLPVTARLSLEHQMYLAGPPIPLQRAAFRVLTGTSRLLGRG